MGDFLSLVIINPWPFEKEFQNVLGKIFMLNPA
jgi:hypothetical protein